MTTMAALDLPGFPEYLECIKHAIRNGGEYGAAFDRNGNWTPVARDPLLRRALARMVTKDKILVPVGGPKSDYKLLPTFEKFTTSLGVGPKWSSISTPNLKMFLDRNVAGISHKELIRLLEHKATPQVLPSPDPFGEGSPRTSPRGTKRRRSSSDASESSHASDPSSLIRVPTPHSSPPSEMKYSFSPIREVRKSASASTTLQLQASGPALSSQEQLKQKLSEMPWIRLGFKNFHEKYPNDEFELVMDEGTLKMKCHDCPKSLIKAEYSFSRGLSNVEAHFKNQMHRHAVKERIQARIPPKHESQSVPTASMRGKEKIQLSSQHISSPSPVFADPIQILSSSAVNPTPPSLNPMPTATSYTPATVNLTPSTTNPDSAVPDTILAIVNPANPAPALSEPSKSHFPVIPGAESNAAAKLGADNVRKGDAVERCERKRPRTQLNGRDTQRLEDLEEQADQNAEDINFQYGALLDTESKLTVQREDIDILKETAKIQTSLIQELKDELSSQVAKGQEGLEILKQTIETQTSLIQELKEELSAARKRGKEYRQSADINLNRAIDALGSKITIQQECVESIKETTQTKASLIQELREEFSLAMKREKDYRQSADVSLKGTTDALESRVNVQQEYVESLKETATTQTSLIQGLREEFLLATKRGEDHRRENDARVEALAEASDHNEKVLQEVKEEFSVAMKRERDSRQHVITGLKGVLESRISVQQECVDSLKTTATKQKALIQEVREGYLLAAKRVDEYQKKIYSRVEALVEASNSDEKGLRGLKEDILLATKRGEEYRQENDQRVKALGKASHVDESYIQELKEEFSLALKRVEECRKQIDTRVGSLASRDGDEARLRAEKKQKVRDLRERILQAKKRGEDLRAKKSNRLDALMKPMEKQTGGDRAALDAEIRVLTEAEQKERAYVSNLEAHLLELFCED